MKPDGKTWKEKKLADNMKPFRFSGTTVYAKYATCVRAEIKDKKGMRNYIRQVVFLLPSASIS